VESATCTGLVPTPPNAFAIPLVHSIEHLEASGALAIFVDGAEALRDPLRRSAVLNKMRAAILAHPVDATLLAQVHAQISTHFGTERVRLRSSSNTEDLPEFNGAGLYTSVSVAIGDPERDIQDGIRTVWASLWSRRAFDEREMGNIDQSKVAMAILVHEAFRAERANGVGISRNILDPGRADERYFNFQVGEAAVTNPAPGVTTEQVIHTPWAIAATRVPEITTLARSSLTTTPVMSVEEVRHVSCVLTAIHDAFRTALDPRKQTPWFAMDIELKLLGDDRQLMVKQARPYSFGSSDIPADCRDFGN
jgi:Pyruvate phosphate dikinase, AMP/ATP-binding domain